MGEPSPPPVVNNPATVIPQQQQANIDSAKEGQAMSMVNQNTDFGNLSYNQTGTGPGGVPLYTATNTLAAPLQNILSALRGGATNQVAQGGYDQGSAADKIGDMTHGITGDIMGQYKGYLDPFFTTSTQQLDTQLRNQGLMPSASSNPADPSTWGPYERAMNQLQQNQGQQVNSLLASVEPQAYNQATSQYLAPLTTAAAELGIINPNTASGSYINPPQANVGQTDVTGAYNNYQSALNDQYKQQVAANGNMMSGIFGVPSAILGGWARSPSGGSAITNLLGMAALA